MGLPRKWEAIRNILEYKYVATCDVDRRNPRQTHPKLLTMPLGSIGIHSHSLLITHSVCPRQNVSMLYALGYLLTRIFSSRSQVITWLLLKDRTCRGQSLKLCHYFHYIFWSRVKSTVSLNFVREQLTNVSISPEYMQFRIQCLKCGTVI